VICHIPLGTVVADAILAASVTQIDQKRLTIETHHRNRRGLGSDLFIGLAPSLRAEHIRGNSDNNGKNAPGRQPCESRLLHLCPARASVAEPQG
jgi:hypothetical protein